jgi:hypothetical protein
MIAGEAPHLETFLLSHKYGRPKDVVETVQKPPILFVSAYGPPGSYDPLAKPPEPGVDVEVIPNARSLAAVGPIEGPPEDDGSLVIVR